MDVGVIKDNLAEGKISVDTVCKMLANSLEANTLLIYMWNKEQQMRNPKNCKVLDEFISVRKSDGSVEVLTGEELLNYLKEKYVFEYEKQEIMAKIKSLLNIE